MKIAVSAPLERPNGEAVRQAAELALEDAGHRAGPHRLQLLLLDSDLGDEVPWEPRRAREAIDDPAVVAYVGPLHSTLTRFSLPLLNEAEIVQLSPSASWPGFTRSGFATDEPAMHYPTGRRHFFRLIPSDDLQGSLAAAWVAAQGYRTLFVVDHGLQYGRGVAEILALEAKQLGLEVLAHESLDLARQDGGNHLAEIAARAAGSEAELVFFGGGWATGGEAFLCALRTRRPEQAILGPEGLVVEGDRASCPIDLLEGVYATQPMPIGQLTSPAARRFGEAYEARTGYRPGPFAVNAYEAVQLLVQVLGGVETPSRPAVLDAVHRVDEYEGVLGRWRFDSRGDRTPQSLAVSRLEHGAWVFVEGVESH